MSSLLQPGPSCTTGADFPLPRGAAEDGAPVRRPPFAGLDCLDARRSTPGPRSGVEDDPPAIIRPFWRIAVVETWIGLVGKQCRPSFNQVHHVQLEPIFPCRAALRRMALQYVG